MIPILLREEIVKWFDGVVVRFGNYGCFFYHFWSAFLRKSQASSSRILSLGSFAAFKKAAEKPKFLFLSSATNWSSRLVATGAGPAGLPTGRLLVDAIGCFCFMTEEMAVVAGRVARCASLSVSSRARAFPVW